MPQRDQPGLPLLLSARMRAWWLLWQVRRSPRRSALAFLAAAAVVAGLAVLAVNAPAGGCHWRVAGIPGGRAHMVCVREGRTA